MIVLEISSWIEFKRLCVTTKCLPCQYATEENAYTILGPDANGVMWRTGIAKTDPRNADQIDFEDNYKDGFNTPMTMSDGRARVYNTVRPWGTRIMYMGQGDDVSDPTKIGGGPVSKMIHEIDGPTPQVMYVDFNTIVNETYMYQMLISFEGMKYDEMTVVGVPRVTTTSAGSNTNYNTYGGYLIIPAAGNGHTVVQDSDHKLVQVTVKEDGVRPAGYWNATFNPSTKQFENITPAPAGDGWFNMFAVEVVLVNFSLKSILNGTIPGWLATPSQEADRIAHGIRMKFSIFTTSPDHVWSIGVTAVLYRQKTI